MITHTSRSIPWDIYDEHLDEAEFLWGRWEDALVAANYALDDVAIGPEARLLAHLDGLVLGGKPIADQLLLPALATGEPRRMCAAAWALIQAEHGCDHQNEVIDVLVNGRPRGRAAIARAMSLAPRTDLERVARVWDSALPAVRAGVLEICGGHELLPSLAWIEPSLQCGEPSLVTAALKALRRSPHPALNRAIMAAFHSDDDGVRTEAIATGVASGLPAAWEACRDAVADSGDACRLPLGLLATSAEKHDRATVHASASDASVKRHAIWALGFAGDIDAAEALIAAAEDDSVARIAAESLSAITGLTLGRSMIKPGRTRGPNVEEVRDDDPPPVVRPEDHLVLPNARALKTWWERERKRFTPGVAHIHGRPRTPEILHGALRTASMWRREIFWLDMAATTGIAPRLDLSAWSVDQRRQWAAGAAGLVQRR